MTPVYEFRETLRYLRQLFQLCGQDILSPEYDHRSIVAYLSIVFWIFVTTQHLITAFDEAHYDASTRFMSSSYFFGATQVYRSKYHNLNPLSQ